MDAELREYLEGMETRFNARAEKTEERLVEMMRDMQTEVLTAFHKWASPTDARMRTHSAALRAIDLEMEALADRVQKLEPPQ